MSSTNPQHQIVPSYLKCKCTRKVQTAEHRNNTDSITTEMVRSPCTHARQQIIKATILLWGRHERGRPKLRFKDTLKKSLQKSGIGADHCETMSADRSEWRHAVYNGTQLYETERRKKQLDKRTAAKVRAQTANRTILCPICSHLCASDFGLRSHMRVHK